METTAKNPIGIVTNGKKSWLPELRACFERCRARLPRYLDLELVEIKKDQDPASIRSALYLHDGTKTARPQLDELVEEDAILPVVDDLEKAGSLPAPLNRVNAVAVGDPPDFTVPVQHAIARLVLRRRERRLFISYRRKDATRMATELNSRLQFARYDTFLDTTTIEYGEKFQERLRAWIHDADALVVIGSPKFKDSKWTRQEIQAAQAANIALVCVLWPANAYKGGKIPSMFHSILGHDGIEQLEPGDFKADGSWKDGVYDRILRRLETVLTEGIVLRTEGLIDAAVDTLPKGYKAEFDDIDPFDLALVKDGQKEARLRVLPFQPTIAAAHELFEATSADGPESPNEAILFYQGDRLTKRQSLPHLRWALDVERKARPARLRVIDYPHQDASSIPSAGPGPKQSTQPHLVRPRTQLGEPFNALEHRDFGAPCVFLSAGAVDPDPDSIRHTEYKAAPASGARIREAVTQIAEHVLARGWNLVFGGQPAISPMVLTIARAFAAPKGPSVICFQSEYYEHVIPPESLDFWWHGRLVTTRDAGSKDASLGLMRKSMITQKNLRAAVFIGGMDGIKKEAEVVPDGVKKFALATTGSAAADLFEEDEASYSGNNPVLADLLRDSTSYARIARRILDSVGSD